MGDGDTVGLRLTNDGLVLERVDVITQHTAGVALAATLDSDDPTFLDAAAWTVCVADAELFTDPLPPLSEILDEYGLVRRGERLAPHGFDYDRWRFERRCEVLGERHGLDADDALVLAALIELHGKALHLVESEDVAGGDDSPAMLSTIILTAGLESWAPT